MSASTTADAPPNASRGACVPSAENFLPHLIEASARPAERGGVSPNAPATPGAKPQANSTVDRNLRAVAGARGRRASNADMDDARRDSARVAGIALPPGEAPSVNPATRRGARPSGNSTPRGGLPVCVAGAASRLSRALRSATPAPPSGTGATERRGTPPAGGVTPKGEPYAFAPTAATNPSRARRGVSLAPDAHM